MNKIFLVITFSIFSCVAMSDYYALGLGKSECGEIVEITESGLETPSFMLVLSFVQGVHSTMNNIAVMELGLGAYTGKNFYPTTKTLSRVIKKFCEENLTMGLDSTSIAVLECWTRKCKRG